MAHYAVEYGITRHPLAFLFCSFSLFFSDIKCGSTAISRIGHPREDLPWVEEELDPEFKAYIQAFEQDQVPEISRLLAACPDKVMTFTSREAINEWIRKKQLTS